MQGTLFSLKFYEDGAALLDPFAALRAFCKQVAANAATKQIEQAAHKRSVRISLRIVGAIVLALVLLVFGVMAYNSYQDEQAQAEKGRQKRQRLFRTIFDELNRQDPSNNKPVNQPAPVAPSGSGLPPPLPPL